MGKALIFGGFKPHFGASFKDFVVKNMFLFASSFWVSLLSYIVHVFGFIFKGFLSSSGKNSAEIGSDFDGFCEKSDEGICQSENEEVGCDQIGAKEVSKMDSEVGSVSSVNTSKYQFISGNSLCAFIEKPQTMSFTVQEMFVNDVSSNRQDFVENHAPPQMDFLGFFDDLNDVPYSIDVPVDYSSSDHDDCSELSSEELAMKQGKTEISTVQEINVNDVSPNSQDFVENHAPPRIDFLGFVDDVSDVVSFSVDVPVEYSSSDHDDCGELSSEELVVKQGKTESSVCEEQETLCLTEHDLNVKGETVNGQEKAPSAEEVIVKQEKTESSVCKEQEVSSSVVKQEKTESSVCEEQEELSLTEHDLYVEAEIVKVDEEISSEHEAVDQVQSSLSNSDDFWATIHKYEFLGSDHNSDFDFDEILCDKGPCEALEPETPMGIGDKRVRFEEDSPRSSDDFSLNQSGLYSGGVSVENEHEDVDHQFIELDPQSLNSTVHCEEQILSDESDSEDEFDQKSKTFDGAKGINASESCDEDDDQTGSDVLLEQKELIRQMKKKMRHLKVNGLPTILEESESPRVEDDLRPLKINEKIGHKDRMDEIQTLYKRYLDKMRKLDILSQQTMYAIGLLQLKNEDQFASNKKVSVPVIKSLLAQNFWSYKLRKHETDPVQKLIRDFQKDLEVVYVGQLCLSWEMLKWQHHKSKELHTHDPDGFRQHNQVAGDFQKFRVILQRFIEDEPFHHGPRVQHYVKSRCSLPSLLQVPLIKDDARGGEWRGKGEGGISIGMLKEVIIVSMRAFWEFLRADKDEVHLISLMGIHGAQVDLQDPSDSELLMEIRSDLQKKEKKLKDLVKSGNCIVKKFQKHQNHRLSHDMFLAQVELRLVSRVLNMSRLTTDQLVWCHKKISKVNIIGRKVFVDSSFLLFPC